MKKPQPAILHVWRILLVLFYCVPALLTALLCAPFSPPWIWSNVIWLTLFLFAFLFYIPARYRSLSFSLEEDALTLRCGVFTRRTRVTPISGVQFTAVWASPLHRLFGLCTLVVVVPGARIALPGLARRDAESLSKLLPGGW